MVSTIAAHAALGWLIMWATRAVLVPLRRIATLGERDNFAYAARRSILRGGVWTEKRCSWGVFRGHPLRRAHVVDHVIPASWGGPARRWNARALCERCNGRRGATVRWHDLAWLAVPGPADAVAWAGWTLVAAAVLQIGGLS